MDYKYKSYLIAYEKCMASDCQEIKRPAYRWVFSDINDPENFIPQFLKPIYKLKKKTNCKGYSLSLFDKQSEAKIALVSQCKDKENLFKVLGTHIAGATLEKAHGVSSVSSTEEPNVGHFSFFEYADVQLEKIFEIKEKVFGDD